MSPIGAIVAACHVAAGEDWPDRPSPLWQDIADAFSELDEGAAVALGAMVADALLESGRRTCNYRSWAAALHYLPRAGWREAGTTLRQRLDVWRVPAPARPADDGARRLRRLACDLVRAGTPGRELLRRLDAADAALPDPLSGDEVGQIALWAVRTIMGSRSHARQR